MITHARILVVTLAAAWVLLGATSGRTPWLSHEIWLVLACMAAGAALAAARWRSRFAARSYVVVVVVIGVVRSLAYLAVGAYSPLAVWMIVTITTRLVFEMYTEITSRRERLG